MGHTASALLPAHPVLDELPTRAAHLVFLATDPIADLPVGFALVSRNEQEPHGATFSCELPSRARGALPGHARCGD